MLRISLFIAAALLLVAGSTDPASAQTLNDVLRYSERAPGTSPRNMGWLDADGTAGSGTHSALLSNPAGLGWASSSTLAGGLVGDFTTNESRLLIPDAQASPFDRTQSGYRISDAAVTYRVPTAQGNLVLGAAIGRTRSFDRTLVASGINGASSITDVFLPSSPSPEPNDDGSFTFDRRRTTLAFDAGAIEYDPGRAGELGQVNNDFVQAVRPGGNRNIEQREDLVESGGLYESSFGGAIEVAPDVMLGGALTVAFGSYTFDRFYEELDVNDVHTASEYDVLLNDAVLSGFDALTFEQRIEADLTGFGARFGASAKPVDVLRVGVSFATPTYYTVNETFGTRIETFFDEGGSLAAGAIDDNEFEYEVRTPWRVSAGAELDLGTFNLAGDIEVIDWSTTGFSADDLTLESDIDRQVRDLDVVINSRVGASFSVDALTVRAATAFQPNPDEGGTRSDRTFFSGGLSYAFDSRLTLDFGWMQERFTDEFVAYGATDVPDRRSTAPGLRADEDIQRNTFSLGLRYRF